MTQDKHDFETRLARATDDQPDVAASDAASAAAGPGPMPPPASLRSPPPRSMSPLLYAPATTGTTKRIGHEMFARVIVTLGQIVLIRNTFDRSGPALRVCVLRGGSGGPCRSGTPSGECWGGG